MRITLFTSNRPRHLALIHGVASMADEVYAVIETSTMFPGRVSDFVRQSEAMQQYFAKVTAAEEEVFGAPTFLSKNVCPLALKMGDLSMLDLNHLAPCLQSDAYIVFGSSYITGPLLDFLVARRAYNLHMGTSPYYRGSSCNFWACFDGRYDYVGATVHLLSRGLDAGPMLFHAFPERTDEAFLLGMRAVKSAHQKLLKYLKEGTLRRMEGIPQERRLEIRYTRNRDFTDEIAKEYLARPPSPTDILKTLDSRDLSRFVRPYVPENNIASFEDRCPRP